MRYQVPQYIEVEDKIFGPLTFKQFIYIVGAGGICVVLFYLLPKFFAFLFSIPVVALGLALAFYKMNGKPFIEVLEAYVAYLMGGKLYIWKKEEKVPVAKTPGEKAQEQIYVPKLSDSKLKDLTWSLDIKENANPVTEDSDKSL